MPGLLSLLALAREHYATQTVHSIQPVSACKLYQHVDGISIQTG